MQAVGLEGTADPSSMNVPNLSEGYYSVDQHKGTRVTTLQVAINQKRG